MSSSFISMVPSHSAGHSLASAKSQVVFGVRNLKRAAVVTIAGLPCRRAATEIPD